MRVRVAAGWICALFAGPSIHAEAADKPFAARVAPLLKRHCFKCHAGADPDGGIDLPRTLAARSPSEVFKTWQKVADALEQKDMPPEEEPQPSAARRGELASAIRKELGRVVDEQARDPGPVVMRRLTSAEYAYTIADLTGLSLDLGSDFVADAVGGEGFANVGAAQFMQDSTLERYLEAAKQVASHAVIGAGPLGFFRDPGKTGLELSAISRIQDIYRRHGFRIAAGEGGEPFGLDRYPKAFHAAWMHRHRVALGLDAVPISQLATQQALAPRFLEHIWSVFNSPSPSFPVSEVIARWRELPAPRGPDDRQRPEVLAACDALYRFLLDWQKRLASNVSNEEQAVVFAEAPLSATKTHSFRANLTWEKDAPTVRVHLSVVSVGPRRSGSPVVSWRAPRVRFRGPDASSGDYRPLAAQDVVMPADGSRSFDLPIPRGASKGELLVEAELDLRSAGDSILRAAIAQGEEAAKGNESWAFLANTKGPAFASWRSGVQDLARLLPQISHREPAPSDRDPIPSAFDNTYNTSERNAFHAKLKYHRDDRFLVEHLLDDDTRRRLDEAWTDLVGSFDYHEIFFQLLADKYGWDLGGRTLAQLDTAWIDRLDEGSRRYARSLFEQQRGTRKTLAASERGHVADALHLARRAWRRPLAQQETAGLLSYYERLRTRSKMGHDPAMRALLARIFVAPEFLYRGERVAPGPGHAPLSDWELASRLSYFLWSSVPDEALARAAEAGELRNPERLAAQARRMLADPKARRLATEFFGQWFGFYRFDRYTGVDSKRFPEFSDRLKASMYDEAVSFFDHIVRADRPVDEILFADYTFVDRELASYYGIEAKQQSDQTARVDGAARFHRGGLMGLGAVLTVTSAPLRTSPVKRGDWILRRVLGTPVPPPPADAGSIAADDVLADRKTVRERLEAHRSKPACVNCHSRMDPLGFALEHYDATGRFRTKYRDGEAIDSGGTLSDGTAIEGKDGLAGYLRKQRALFHRTLATKLAGYALGRSQELSDQHLIDRMIGKLASGPGRFSDVVVDIVGSPQFRQHRAGS